MDVPASDFPRVRRTLADDGTTVASSAEAYMIRAQRRTHRAVWTLLGPLLLLVVLGGLALRPAPLIQSLTTGPTGE